MFIALIVVLALLLLLAWRVALCRFRAPDFVIGKPGSVYMSRWWVIPRNRWFNVYLHEILRSDDDRALHDHPWLNCSIVLKGGYFEVVPEHRPSFSFPVPPTWDLWRGQGSVVLRRPTAAHRLVIGGEGPCWSLFITGPKVREWGFWCPKGWKKWTDFVAMGNTGEVGQGCDDAPLKSGARIDRGF